MWGVDAGDNCPWRTIAKHGDMILRSAAIEALTGFETDPTDEEIERAIKAIPAVDAIPVEWLESVRNDADDAGDLEMRDAITGLIDEWHRKEKD